MRVAKRRTAWLTAAAAAIPLASLGLSAPAEAAFKLGRSPDFPICTIWLNEAGQPLRNRSGREIAQEVPCPGQLGGRERYKAYAGETPNTLVVIDETHHAECALALAKGSTTLMLQTVCQELGR